MPAVKTKRISTLIESQLPEFISTEYQLFSKFLTKYYEQQEVQGGTLDIINNIQKYADIDYEKGELKMYALTIIKGSFFDNRISVRVKPLSNDVKALREVYLDVDVANSSITAYKE